MIPQTSVMYVSQLCRNAAFFSVTVAEVLFIVDCSAFKEMAVNLQHQCTDIGCIWAKY